MVGIQQHVHPLTPPRVEEEEDEQMLPGILKEFMQTG